MDDKGARAHVGSVAARLPTSRARRAWRWFRAIPVRNHGVLPGDYTIGLEVDSNASDDARVYAPLGEPIRVTIAPNARVRVDL